MSKRIPISFKENENDNKILAEIYTHSDKSVFVKECIQYWIDNFKNKINKISNGE